MLLSSRLAGRPVTRPKLQQGAAALPRAMSSGVRAKKAAGPHSRSSSLGSATLPHHRTTTARVLLQDDIELAPGSRDRPDGASGAGAQRAPAPAAQAASWGSYLALFGVAILWGSYTPAIRLLYQIDTPPDPPLMNALQACLSAAFLVFANLTATFFGTKFTHPERAMPLMAEDSAIMKAILRKDHAASKELHKLEAAALSAASAATTKSMTDAAAALVASPPAPPRRAPSNAVEHALASALNWRSGELLVAGAEVGVWMSLAFSLEVAGLQLASATKVAFLNQVSVLITPLLVHLSGERVRLLEWAACGLGLLGSVLVAADSLMSGGAGEAAHGVHAAAAGEGNELLGLVFVLISALFFALSTVRLGRYSSMYEPLQLSTVSMCTLGLCSLVWITAAVMGQPDGGASEWAIVHTMLGSTVCVLTLLWVGLGPGALAAYLQATGQRSVPPAQAQVIYSTTPLWAAGFAFLALDAQDEAMGSIAWVGAAVMLGSSLMTALLPPDNTDAAHNVLSVSSIDSDDDDAEAGMRLLDYSRPPVQVGSSRNN